MQALGKRQADDPLAVASVEKKRRKSEKPSNGPADTENVEIKAKKDKKDKKEKKEKKDKKDKKEKKEKKEKKDKKHKSKSEESSEKSSETPTDAESTPSATPPSEPAAEKPASNNGYSQCNELLALPKSSVDAYYKEHNVIIEDPSKTDNIRPITEFSFLPKFAGIRQDYFKAFKSPTSIQALTWPYLLMKRDLVGIAETGSGKTLAFGLPCMRDVAAATLSGGSKKRGRNSSVKAVILSPTRELALQIHDQLDNLADHSAGIHVVCLYGGSPKDQQREQLKKASIAIGTPGRLKDFLMEDPSRFAEVQYLVLDEADRMLDKGFEEELRAILGMLPKPSADKPRQTVMFTATWPSSIQKLASSFMTDPVKITVGQLADPEAGPQANLRITQTVEVMDGWSKDSRLLQVLKDHQRDCSGANKKDQQRTLVFCLYKKEATRVEQNLRKRGISVGGIHGDMNQSARIASLAAFKDGSVPVLVATDVAARGLDIPDVGLVVNVTFPLTIEDYVHRIGRTGRAGKAGKAITFFTEHDKAHSGALINVLTGANQPVPKELLKFGTTVKKKEHSAYGAFFKSTSGAKEATRITFD